MENWSSYKTESAGCAHAIPVYDFRKGEIICSKCGLVLLEHMIDSQVYLSVTKIKRKMRKDEG